MYARPERYELAMTHRPDGQRCVRPSTVTEMAERLLRWASAAEGCVNCRQVATCVRGGVALCQACKEQRAVRADVLPIRGRLAAHTQRAEGGVAKLTGHAIVFNKLSVDVGGFREIIAPEAVDRLLAEGTDLRALWNHDSSVPLGRVSAGTLTVRKDRTGLATEIDPPKSAVGYVESVQRGDVRGMSFAFMALDDEWHMENGGPVRVVTDMDVSEVSVVTWPAYQATDVSTNGRMARSLELLERIHKTRLAR